MEHQDGMNSIGNQSDSVYEMSSSTENIDNVLLQEAGDPVEISGVWSATASTSNLSDTTSSNTYINVDTLKECCADSSDTLNEKNDFMVVDTTATKFNADETKNLTMCKVSAFQKKHKSSFNNVSHMFENILDDDSQIEESIYLSRFQKRKRLLPPDEEVFDEINKSDISGMDSVDVSIKSSKTYFKHPSSDLSLINASTNNMDESKTKALSHKFTRRTIDLVNSAFDNVICDSSGTSSIIELSNKNTTLNKTQLSNLDRNSLCDTVEMPSMNHTYNVPINSTQVELLSQNTKVSCELSNIEQPINETYTLENNSMSNNVPVGSLNAKNTLSDTYTIENNLNGTFSQQKSGLKSSNKTTSTLTDMSNIFNQSKSPVRKPHFMRKLQMDEESQEYNITICSGNNSTVNDEMNQAENNTPKRFKLSKMNHNANSIIFDNVITSCQSNDMSTTDTISKTLNASVVTSKSNDLFNISSGSKLKKNVEESVNKSMTRQSYMHLNKSVENNINVSDPSLFNYNKSNSFSQRSNKFNFSKQYGRHSVSYHEKSFHDLSILQNTKCMLSQSQGPHFTVKPNLNAHSGVFNDIIDNSSDSNISPNISKAIKFKNYKNISEGYSLMFENVIKNSQESNSAFTQNKTLGRSVVYDQSKIQASDEVSLYANANELSFSENSSRNSNNSFEKYDQSKIQASDEVSLYAKANDLSFNEKSSRNSNNSFEKLDQSKIQTSDEVSLYAKANDLSFNENSSRNSNNSFEKLDQSKVQTSDEVSLYAKPNDPSLNEKSSRNSNNSFENRNQSKIQTSDEVSLYAKANDLSFNENSSRNSNNSFEKLDQSKVQTSDEVSLYAKPNDPSLNEKSSRNSNNSFEKRNQSKIQESDEISLFANVNDLSYNEKSSRKSINLFKKYDQSKIQASDEVSLFANDDLLYDEKSSRSSNNSFEKQEISKIVNLEESKCLEDGLKNNKRISTCSSKQRNNSFANDTINKSAESSISNESNKSLENISTCSSKTSKSVAYSQNESTNNNVTNDSTIFTSSESSIESRKTYNDTSMLEIDLNNGTISTNLSKQSNNVFANDLLASSNMTDELTKNNESSSTEVFRLSSESVKKNKSLPNESVLKNESLLISENSMNNISTQSSKISKIAYSKNENSGNATNSVLLSTLPESSINCENTSLKAYMLKDNINEVSEMSTHLSKQKNNSTKNDLIEVSSITDELPENNKTFSARKTRSSSKSFKINKSSSNKTVLDNDSITPENNVNQISTRSSNSVIHSNTVNVDKETDDSVFWTTKSECSTDSGKTSNNILIPDDINNISTTSKNLLKQSNSSFVNNLPAVSSVIDELPENNKPYNTRNTRSSSKSLNDTKNKSGRSSRTSNNSAHSYSENVDNSMDWTTESDNSSSSTSFKNNKSLSNKTVLGNDSITTKNNVNQTSTHSSKSVTHFNTKNIDNETVDTEFCKTVSGHSTDPEKTSSNISIPDNMNNISIMSTSLLKKTKKSFTNNLPVGSSIIDELSENNKLSNTRKTRSSFKSLVSENNTKNKSSRSFRTSKSSAHSYSEHVDNSMDWMTMSDNSSSSTSFKNNKSFSNETVLGNDLNTTENNVKQTSTRSSKSATHSNTENIDNETVDSEFWTTVSGRSTDSEKTSSNISIPDNMNNISSKSSSLLKKSNKSLVNNLSAVSSFIEESPDNNPSNTRKTRSSSKSFKNNKSLSNKTVLDSNLISPENNVNQISTRSSKSVTHSNTENVDKEIDDSVFWTTVSGSSNDSEKISSNILIPDDMNKSGTKSTSLLKKSNKSFANNLPAVSSTIDEFPENNKTPSTRKTRSSSKSFKINKSSSNKIVLGSDSIITENNVNQISTRSSKSVTHSNTENVDNEIDDSVFWTTVSGCSTDELPDHNKPCSTSKTRSSLKSLVSENNTKNKSSRSSRTSKSSVHSYSQNVDNSMDWTTVSDNSSSEVPIQNEFQTPTNNKVTINERIINAIGIMSANKQKSTHPGVFELEENVNKRLTRSIVHSSNNTPSILTRALDPNNTFESALSFTEDILFNQSPVENVKEKFNSLYNKESWITKRLYNFLVSKLNLMYDIYSVKYAEKFVKYLASMLTQVNKDKDADLQLYSDMMRYHMARYGIIKDTSDYLGFLTNYIPYPYYDKLMPGWNLDTSVVKFDQQKYFIPIMEDEEFLRNVLENLNVA